METNAEHSSWCMSILMEIHVCGLCLDFLGRPCKCREGGTLTLDCPVHYKGEIPLVKCTCVYCMWKSTCSLCGVLHMESVVCSVWSQWCANSVNVVNSPVYSTSVAMVTWLCHASHTTIHLWAEQNGIIIQQSSNLHTRLQLMHAFCIALDTCSLECHWSVCCVLYVTKKPCHLFILML